MTFNCALCMFSVLPVRIVPVTTTIVFQAAPGARSILISEFR